MIVNPYIFGGYDADALAFFTATGITDTSIKNCVNTLVLDLKAAGIWTKMKAIYPFVGGTATTHKYNLKNPADTNAAFRLVFSGGWTHSSTGALPNGTNAYANTYFNPSSDVTTTSFSMGYYSRTNNNTIVCDFGAANNGPGSFAQLLSRLSGLFYGQINSQGIIENVSNSDSRGLYMGSRTSSSSLYLQRNSTQTSFTQSTGAPNYNLYLGCRNTDGSPNLYSARECAFAFTGDGLTTTNGTDLYTIIQNFQTCLGRQV